MDCSDTDGDWFEFRGWLSHAGGYSGWEESVIQESCNGSAGLPPPRHSNSHLARCGYINVFEWGEGRCTMEPVPDASITTEMPGSTESPIARTVVFLEAETSVGEEVFIRGGLEAQWVPSLGTLVYI